MSTLPKTFRKLLVQPAYLLAVLLLGAGALGLNVCTDYLKLHFRKQPVEMRVASLIGADGIPATLGNWVMVSKDKPLEPDVEHVLGTRQYLQRTYVNRQLLGAAQVEQLQAMPTAEREKALWQIETEQPEAVVDIGIFYYTGMVDTVAHVPERCYLADGFEMSNAQVMEDRKAGTYADGRERRISFRFLNFEDQSERNRLATNVAYLFHVDGHYEDDPLGVRRSLQNLLERYGYYAKVELKTVSLTSSNEAKQKTLAAMEDMFSNLLPQFERCMPDWDALHRKSDQKAVATTEDQKASS